MSKHLKDNLKKMLILVPLVLIATGAYAAYSFVGPTTTPTGNNTDAPIDISASNQVKNGDFGVKAFQVVGGAQFSQQTQLTGLVNGGTTSTATSTITFGNSTDKTSINNTGSAAITGYYQSDSLKTGGSLKPLCADQNGTFYICGTSVASNPNPIYVQADIQTDAAGAARAGAFLSEPTNGNVTVNLAAVAAGTRGSAMNFVRNMFTAHAVQQGVCRTTATPTPIGTVTIFGGSTNSGETVSFPTGCDQTNTEIIISSYSPQSTMGGRPIIAQ